MTVVRECLFLFHTLVVIVTVLFSFSQAGGAQERTPQAETRTIRTH